MTLKIMQGFESMRDDTDFRAQNWIAAPTKQTAVFPPSITSVAGTSLSLLAAGSGSSTAPGATGAPDLGYFNTGITVNQAWLAGGFSLGFAARFNSGVQSSYAAGYTATGSWSMQACFDGTRYWAVKLVGSTYSLAYSTDLTNWTASPAQPTTLASTSSVFYLGNGLIGVIGVSSGVAAYSMYYTTNNGSTWSAQALGSVPAGNNVSLVGMGIATGNATYPHAIWITTQGSSAPTAATIILVGTVGGTLSTVYSTTVLPPVNITPRKIGGILVAYNLGTQISMATASNAALNTSAAWANVTLSTTVTGITDIAYNPTSNLWILATQTGLWTFSNPGAAGTPTIPSGTVTVTQRYSTAAMLNVYWNGSLLVATGLQGHIVNSADGITWTESGGHILPVGVSGTDWRCAIYDGSRYVLFSDATNGVIATTPDGVTNYQVTYVADGAENRNGTNACGAVGVYSGTPPASATGLWTANIYGLVIVPGAASAGARPLTMYYRVDGNEPAGDLKTGSVPTTPLQHYYELVGVATSTPNTFLISLYVDGALLLSDTVGRLMGSAVTDITSLMILVPSRTGSFVAYDDLYFTLTDGVAPSGVLGPVSMVAEVPATDVQAQWAKVGTAASNSLSVAGPALSSNPANYITSSNAGDKDIYRTSGSTPSGYVVKAVQVEATFSKTTTGSPVVNLGLLSSGTESDSTNLTVASVTGTYLSQIYAKDPNGSITWTNTAADASEPVINHIS